MNKPSGDLPTSDFYSLNLPSPGRVENSLSKVGSLLPGSGQGEASEELGDNIEGGAHNWGLSLHIHGLRVNGALHFARLLACSTLVLTWLIPYYFI